MGIRGNTKHFQDILNENLSDKKDIKKSFKIYTKDDVKEEVDVKYFSSKDLLEKALEELKKTSADDFISYGYKFLDNHLGGIDKSDLIIIGGETGTGKTLFANNIVIKASAKHKVAIWSLEDNPMSILKQRIYNKINELRRKEGKKSYPFIAYWKNELKDKNFCNIRQEAYNIIKNEIKENLLYVDTQQTPTIELLEKEIKKQSEMGVKLMLVDHLHKFNFKSQSTTNNKGDLIEEFMNRLRRVQDETGMRVILIVHYSKLNGAKPILDSFKDSVSIPQNASVIINLWRDRGDTDSENNNTNSTLIMIPKIRIPVPEVTFEAEFDPEINDYVDDDMVFGTKQGDEYHKEKEKQAKNEVNTILD